METSRSRALKSLNNSMPVANQEVAAGLQRARLMGVQRAVAATPSPASTREVQAAGAQQTTEAGKIALGAQQQTQDAATSLAKTGLAATATADASALNTKRAAVTQKARTNEAELASLGRDLKQKVFDSRVQFKRDEQGRAVLNEQQLADWAVRKSKSAEELKTYAQKAEQAHARKIQFLRTVQAKLESQLAYEQQKREVDRNGATMARIAEAAAAMKERIRQAEADAANKQAAWQAGGTILGTAAGAAIPGGGAVGAVVGGSLGGAVGTTVGATTR